MVQKVQKIVIASSATHLDRLDGLHFAMKNKVPVKNGKILTIFIYGSAKESHEKKIIKTTCKHRENLVGLIAVRKKNAG